jgi:hypothetical protein
VSEEDLAQVEMRRDRTEGKLRGPRRETNLKKEPNRIRTTRGGKELRQLHGTSEEEEGEDKERVRTMSVVVRVGVPGGIATTWDIISSFLWSKTPCRTPSRY